MDSENESCDPNDQPYSIWIDSNNRIDCETGNTSECAKNTCKCDEAIAFMLASKWSEMSDDAITQADGSGFDYANNCKASNNNNESNGGSVKCCGVYPNRVTYNTGKHDCCYNTFLSNIGGC